MNKADIKQLLQKIKDDKIEVEAAVKMLEDLPYKELGFAKIDNHREIRVGYPEVIYCEGKTIEQVKSIIEFMLTKNNNIGNSRE